MDENKWKEGSSLTEGRLKRGGLAAAVALFIVGSSHLLGTFPVNTEDPFQALIFFTLMIAGGLYLFTSTFVFFKHRNLMTSTPTAKARSVSMGYAELKGDVAPDTETLMAPFSGKDAVTYSYKVEEWRYDGDDHDWEEVEDGRSGTTFFLDDGTGQVLIDPRGALLDIPQTTRTVVRPSEELPEPIKQYEEGGISKKRRYTEHSLTPGDDVYVLGEAMERPGVSSSTNAENVVVNQDENTPFFYISTNEEEELVSRMTWYMVGSFIGGTGLFLGGLALILMFYGLF